MWNDKFSAPPHPQPLSLRGRGEKASQELADLELKPRQHVFAGELAFVIEDGVGAIGAVNGDDALAGIDDPDELDADGKVFVKFVLNLLLGV